MNRCNGGRAACVLIAVALLLVGCANAQKLQCESGDWESAGYRDGEAGRGYERIGKLAERCSDYDVEIDSAAWTAGYQAGIALHCEPGNGFDLGEAGTDYAGNCPPKLEARFLGSYVRGLGLHRDQLSLDFDRLQARLGDERRKRQRVDDEDDLEDIDERIGKLEKRLDQNLDARRLVNRRIGRWSREL